ncbi:MAG: hypothetical protein OXR66_05825 [Candidatus Woesearchaeota archaeon]|nr:hypothetical protein [Candidatus Woesearchaeota archaeon]
MKQLDIAHHKFIMLCFVLLVFLTGVFFGVKLSSLAGQEGMLVLIFGLSFLSIIMLFLIFTQVVHVHDLVRRKKK